MAKRTLNYQTQFVNKKAEFLYFFKKEYEAGIMLTGTEVKSIRAGAVNLKDSYCYFQKNELFVKNLFIGEYKLGTTKPHETRRVRKLLLKKQELKKLKRQVVEKSNTIIPYILGINDRGFVKLVIVVATGKKKHDKRASLKEKDLKRSMNRIDY